jgi:hypothetical protein
MQSEMCAVEFVELSIMASKEPETESRLSTIGGDLKWHRGIGWGIVGIYAVICAGFLTWYLPKELSSQRESIGADTAKQLSPLSERIAVLTAVLETRAPDASKKIPELLKQNLSQPQNQTLGLQTISAVTRKATEDKVNADPQQIADVGTTLVSMNGLFATATSGDAWNP